MCIIHKTIFKNSANAPPCGFFYSLLRTILSRPKKQFYLLVNTVYEAKCRKKYKKSAMFADQTDWLMDCNWEI
jgi:hypothetical protein